MTKKYMIDTKNGAGVMLEKSSIAKNVTITPFRPDGSRFDNSLYNAAELRTLSAELLTAADKLEAGTLFEEEFDWDTVENGMAFDHFGDTVWYVGKDFADKHMAVVTTDDGCADFDSVNESTLTRAPEHDIKKG